MKFSKEEISLCKKIAEKQRKEIGYGDWFYIFYHNIPELNNENPKILLHDGSLDNKYNRGFIKEKITIPLWQISDCLDWIEEKGFTYTLNFITPARGYELILFENHQKRPRIFVGETKEIICLKAVLAILKEKS